VAAARQSSAHSLEAKTAIFPIFPNKFPSSGRIADMFGIVNDPETIPVSGDPGDPSKWRRKEDSRRPGSVTPNSCDFRWVFFYFLT